MASGTGASRRLRRSPRNTSAPCWVGCSMSVSYILSDPRRRTSNRISSTTSRNEAARGLHGTFVPCRRQSPVHCRQLPQVIPGLLHSLRGPCLLAIFSRIVCNRRRRHPRLCRGHGLGGIFRGLLILPTVATLVLIAGTQVCPVIAHIAAVCPQVLTIRPDVTLVLPDVALVRTYILLLRLNVLPIPRYFRAVGLDTAAVSLNIGFIARNIRLLIHTVALLRIVVAQITLIGTNVRPILRDVLALRLDVATVSADVPFVGLNVASVLRHVLFIRLDIPLVRLDIPPVGCRIRGGRRSRYRLRRRSR